MFLIEGLFRLTVSLFTTSYVNNAMSDLMLKAMIVAISVSLVVLILKAIWNWIDRNRTFLIPGLLVYSSFMTWLHWFAK